MQLLSGYSVVLFTLTISFIYSDYFERSITGFYWATSSPRSGYYSSFSCRTMTGSMILNASLYSSVNPMLLSSLRLIIIYSWIFRTGYLYFNWSLISSGASSNDLSIYGRMIYL